MAAVAVVGGTELLAGAALGGLVLAPVLAVGGVMRGVNNSKVNKQIEYRQAPLPIVLQAEKETSLNVFFPLAPPPRQVEITYADSQGEHTLIIDTHAVLDGLHLVQRD